MSNEVNEVLDSEMKDLLLTWLFKFGRDCATTNQVWDYLDNAYLNFDIDATMTYCFDSGYLDKLRDPFTKQYSHRLTDAGLEFLNERHK